MGKTIETGLILRYLILSQKVKRVSTIHIHNLYYDGTVEAKVYRKLRSRINAFTAVVGNLQPILAQVPTFIEQAAMSADPEEEDVLMSEFDNLLTAPQSRLSIEEMVQININADPGGNTKTSSEGAVYTRKY